MRIFFLAAAMLAGPVQAEPEETVFVPVPPIQEPGHTSPAADQLFADAQGVRIAYQDLGEGTPVLLLTGGPGFSGEQLAEVAAHIAQTRRAILPDQRGTGASTTDEYTTDLFSLDQAVADLEALRAATGLGSWTIVGHSYGGLLAMAYAAQHPDQVDSLVLICPAGLDPSFWADYNANLLTRLSPEEIETVRGVRLTEQTDEAIMTFMREMNAAVAPGMVENRDVLPEVRRQVRSESMFNPRVNVAMRPSLMSLDLTESIRRYEGPTTLIRGEHDPIGKPAAVRIITHISETGQEAQLVEISGTAHWPFLEAPELFYQQLDAALQAGTTPETHAEPASD